MNRAVALAAEILSHAKGLNAAVREDIDDILVADARRVVDMAEEAKGWLIGIVDLLEVK